MEKRTQPQATERRLIKSEWKNHREERRARRILVEKEKIKKPPDDL